MKMQVGKVYLTKNGAHEEVLLVHDGKAFCQRLGSKQCTLYGWDAKTGKALSLGSEYDIASYVTFVEVHIQDDVPPRDVTEDVLAGVVA